MALEDFLRLVSGFRARRGAEYVCTEEMSPAALRGRHAGGGAARAPGITCPSSPRLRSSRGGGEMPAMSCHSVCLSAEMARSRCFWSEKLPC